MSKGSKYRPVNSDRYGKNFETIFRKEKVSGHVDYVPTCISDNSSKDGVKLIDTAGNPVKLSSYQKNHFYKKAKEFKETIKGALLTEKECWNPSEHNVQKMLDREFRVKGHIDKLKQHMRAIGADPRDYDVEKIRRRKR